jgi:UDP-N-acetylglucosamine acyltransferase
LEAQNPAYRLLRGAWVHREARLPEDPRDLEIEPGALIGPGVELGRGNWIGAGAVIYGPTRIGNQNQIHPQAVIGGAPQDLGYAGEPTRLEIGDRNVFREGVTVSRASTKGGRVTRIGNDNLFMAFSHVGHDAVVEDRVVLANAVLLAGHCHVHSNVNIAGGCAIVQFVTVGRFAFICGTSGIRKDVEPFVSHDLKVRNHGEPTPACINEVGLRRAGTAPEVIQKLRTAYKVLFLRKTPFRDFAAEAADEIARRGAACDEVNELVNFVGRKRGTRFGRQLQS